MTTGIIITIIALQIITGLLIAYLTNYVNQKGKNWANKSDLKDLTEIVEEVKQKFQQDNECLKAELNILIDRKTQVFTEEKESLILFYTSINEWMWDKCNIPIFDYNHTNYNDLGEKIIALKKQYSQVQVLFSKVQLLADNPQLVEVGNQFILENLKLHQFVENNCTNLKRNLSWDKSMIDMLVSKEFNFQNSSTEIKDFMKRLSEDNKKDKEGITTGYHDKHLELFKVSLKLRSQLQGIIKQHLKA